MVSLKEFYNRISGTNANNLTYAQALGILTNSNAVYNTLNVNQKNGILSVIKDFKKNINDKGGVVPTRTRTSTAGITMKYFNVNRKPLKNSPNKPQRTNSSSKVRYPWILLKQTNEGPEVQSVNFFGLSTDKWTVNWKRNAPWLAFPTSKITGNGGIGAGVNVKQNGRVITQTVGKVCQLGNKGHQNLTKKCQGQWTRTNLRNRYVYIPSYSNANAFNTYKNGIAGMSVVQLLKVIGSISTIDARRRQKARADFAELKRNGDYGEIYTVKELNKDNHYFIKPGDLGLAKHIVDEFQRNKDYDVNNYLKQFQGSNYFYCEGCFWSTDRPALFLCMLEEQPFVRCIGSEYRYHLEPVQLSRIVNALNIQDDTYEKKVLLKIIELKNTNNNLWFFMMCVIDTAHDFGRGSSRASTMGMRGKQEMLKNILKALGPRRGFTTKISADIGTWDNFVEKVWNATKIENLMGAVINRVANGHIHARSTANATGNRVTKITKLRNELENNGMCIVWDSGSIPSSLKHLTALAAAKFLDPAS